MELDAIEQTLIAGHFRFTDHVREQMAKRQLTDAEVGQVLASPEEVLARPGRPDRRTIRARRLLVAGIR